MTAGPVPRRLYRARQLEYQGCGPPNIVSVQILNRKSISSIASSVLTMESIKCLLCRASRVLMGELMLSANVVMHPEVIVFFMKSDSVSNAKLKAT